MKPSQNSVNLSCLCLLLLTVLAPGCDYFSDTTTSSTQVNTVTWDERLPSGMEEWFATAIEPLEIVPGMESIDLGCELADLSSVEAQAFCFIAGAAGDVSLSSPVPEEIDSFTETIDGLPWPVQNCEINFDGPISFEGLSLFDLDAKWYTRGGKPTYRIDFDFNGRQDVAEIDIDIDVDCPSSVSTWLVNLFSSSVQKALRGKHDISAANMDLDIYISFEPNGDRIDSEVDVRFLVGDVDIDLDWSKVKKYMSESEIEGMAEDLFQTEGEDVFTQAFSGLGDTMADALEQTIEDGHEICSMKVQSGELVMKTSPEDAAFPCMELKAVLNPNFSAFGP